jgi:hypothetical protein
VVSDYQTAAVPQPAPVFEYLSFGRILDKAIHFYAKKFLLLIGIMAIPQALSFLAGMISPRMLGLDARTGQVVIYLINFMVAIVATGVGSAAVTAAVSSAYLGRPTSFAKAYAAVFKKLGDVVSAKFLSGMLMIAGFILVVPGIIFFLMYSLTSPAVMLENLSGTAAMKRSKDLVKGYKGQMLGFTLLYYLGYFVIYILMIIVIAIIYVASGAESTVSFAYQFMAGAAIYASILAVLVLLIAPFPPIVALLVYYNQRIRKESFDLDLLAEAMSSS